MDYPVERFTEAERARIAPHVSHLDRPVFALLDLPETVKGALFARYSRYPGTLQRLFLDEFADSVGALPVDRERGEGKRAAQLYETIFLGYGDDSVAQLGGAHVACEWVSNILTKVLQRPRLAAYLEQSTRYIAYDRPMDEVGSWRYFRAPELGPEYPAAMDALFAAYAEALPRVEAWAAATYPRRDEESVPAHARAIRAKALDLLRGLLPAASLSHMGIYASGQSYEGLILHLLAHPLPEARRYGRWILEAVQAVMPSFVTRVERPDRGGRWVEHLEHREAVGRHWAARLGLEEEAAAEARPSVRLLRVEGDENLLLAASLFEAGSVSEDRALDAVGRLGEHEKDHLFAALAGPRENRRHRPGRGWEAVRYRFEIVSDYGAFRDLQRHRMLTVQWQPLTPALGAGVPEEVEAAGVGDLYRSALERSRAEWGRLTDTGAHPLAAQYALCLGFRIRYVLDLNAREAMQLIELRSGREGHPSYRAVAHELHRAIAGVHPRIAAAMVHLDRDTEPRLERILSEMRTQERASRIFVPAGS